MNKASLTRPRKRLRKPPPAKPEGQYHHGDLRRSLIDCGTHLLDTEGVDAMSLRSAARLAGVSPAAPAHHFGDKNGLLAAIAARGFRELNAQKSIEGLSTRDVAGRLRALVRGYVGFARNHPARFNLMFGPQIIRRAEYEELMAESMASYATLRAVLEPMIGRPNDAALPLNDFVFGTWAMLHGLASLASSGKDGPTLVASRSLDVLSEQFSSYVLVTLKSLKAPAVAKKAVRR